MTSSHTRLAAGLATTLAAGLVVGLPGQASASNASVSWRWVGAYTISSSFTDSTNTIRISGGDGLNSFRTVVKPQPGVSGGRATVTIQPGGASQRSLKLTGLPEDRAYRLYSQVYDVQKKAWTTKKSTPFYT